MELVRLWLGMLTAVALPGAVPGLGRRPVFAVIFAALYGAYSILPVVSGPKALALLVLVIALSVRWGRLAGTLPNQVQKLRARVRALRPPARGWFERALRRVAPAVALAFGKGRLLASSLQGSFTTLLLLFILAGAAVFGRHSFQVIRHLLLDDRLAIVVSGFLVAVFIGNQVVVKIVAPYLAIFLQEGVDLEKTVPLGLYLGWAERALVFTFIATGHPEAAALALAAKALTRLPAVASHSASFGQYVIVGTLASVLVAVAVGMLVRLSIGLQIL
ncbi:hypothetical protein [Longispora urticae]